MAACDGSATPRAVDRRSGGWDGGFRARAVGRARAAVEAVQPRHELLAFLRSRKRYLPPAAERWRLVVDRAAMFIHQGGCMRDTPRPAIRWRVGVALAA